MDSKGPHCFRAQLEVGASAALQPQTPKRTPHAILASSTCAFLCVGLVWPGKDPCLQHSLCSPCLVRPVFYDSCSKVFFCQIQIFHSTSARALHWMPDGWTEKMKTEHCVFIGCLGGIFRKDVNSLVYLLYMPNGVSTVWIRIAEGFPGGPVVKNWPANVGNVDSIPHLRRSHVPQSNKSHVLQWLSLRAATTEACMP